MTSVVVAVWHFGPLMDAMGCALDCEAHASARSMMCGGGNAVLRSPAGSSKSHAHTLDAALVVGAILSRQQGLALEF
jgi:hypothetical protein